MGLKIPWNIGPKNPNRSHGTPKSHGTRVPTCPKAWDLAVPEIFVPGLSQRYLSQSQASQKNQSQSRSQVPGFVSRDTNPMGFKSHCPSLLLHLLKLLVIICETVKNQLYKMWVIIACVIQRRPVIGHLTRLNADWLAPNWVNRVGKISIFLRERKSERWRRRPKRKISPK